MAGKGWERYLYPPLVRTVRSEKVERPSPVLMGLAPGPQMSPNHVMMARALGLAWLTKWGDPQRDQAAVASLVRIIRAEGERQVATGIWTIGNTSEQFAPSPHEAYWMLPALVFAQHPTTAKPWQSWWRGTITAWQKGASPAGEVFLPCGRWAGRFSQVVDACYRNLFHLPHRNNKFQKVAWPKWASFFEPLSGFAAAVEFEKIVQRYQRNEDVLGLDGSDDPTRDERTLAPVLALPTTIRRTPTGLTATMLPRPGINVTKAAWRVTADWSQKDKPAKWAVSLERPAESAAEARRLRLEV